MIIYYDKFEFELNKHHILTVWAEKGIKSKPVLPVQYEELEIDETYNGEICQDLYKAYWESDIMGATIPPRFWVDNDGNILHDGKIYPVIPNTEKETWKLSALHGLTQAQLETYIDNNVTTLAQAKEFLKKLATVVLLLMKHTNLSE